MKRFIILGLLVFVVAFWVKASAADITVTATVPERKLEGFYQNNVAGENRYQATINHGGLQNASYRVQP